MTLERLCHINDINDDSSRGFTLANDISVFIVKKDGQLHAYRNSCPHLGIELEWLEDQFLDADNMLIQCSTHGALFLIDSGECVAGPCRGQALTPAEFTIDTEQYLCMDANQFH